MHHIRSDMLAQHGRSVIEVARLLNDRLHGSTVFSDGWVHDGGRPPAAATPR